MKTLTFAGLALSASLAFSGAAAADDIAIAVAGPMTGGEATFGLQMKNGAELAVADLNAAGGVLGKQIRLETGDDACDPKQARAVAEKLAGEGVVFVTGHFCSSSSIPASDAYAENGVLQITPASTNPQFTERGLWNTFRVCGRDDQQGAVAAAYIEKNFPKKKSPSFTTSRHTARVLRIRPRLPSTRWASRRRCTKPTPRATRTFPPWSPR